MVDWTLCGLLLAVDPVPSRHVVLGCLTASLVMGGCGVGIQDESPRHYGVTVASTASLEDGIEMLSAAEAELIRNRAAGEAPADVGSHALAVGFFGVGEYDDPPRRPSELLVANYWSTLLRMNVVCLVDGVQVSCSQDGGVWRIELDEPGMAFVDLPEADARRDVILVEERDHMVERVYPVSSVRSIDGWDVPFSTLGDAPPTIENPLGGCNWALLMDDLDQRETFEPLRNRRVGDIYLVMSTCPDTPSHHMRPVILIDDTTVAQTSAFRPFVAQPGTTYALKIPDELFETARTIRGAVIRRAPDSGHWTTHPLFTTADE